MYAVMSKYHKDVIHDSSIFISVSSAIIGNFHQISIYIKTYIYQNINIKIILTDRVVKPTL